MHRNAQKGSGRADQRMGYFRVETSTWRRLQAIANREQLTVSDVVRRAIREFLSGQKAA